VHPVSADYVETVGVAEPDRERALRLCSIYFFHELIHVAQGIRKKASVIALRAVGSKQHSSRAAPRPFACRARRR